MDVLKVVKVPLTVFKRWRGEKQRKQVKMWNRSALEPFDDQLLWLISLECKVPVLLDPVP